MKKLLITSLAFCVGSFAFAGEADLEKALKEKAKAAYSADAINSVIEVSFNVKTLFSPYDIVDKNADHLSLGYMIPGNSKKGTNWNIDEIEDMEPIVLPGHTSDYDGTVFINEDYRDRNGNYHEIIRNYKYQPKGCSMFLIDENWLIGSIECIGSETEGAVGYPNHVLANTPYRINEKIIEDDLHFAHDENIKAPAKGHIFQGPNLVLVYIGDVEKVKNMMTGKPKANVAFFKENIFSMLADGSVSNDFVVRTSRFDSGAIRSRSLKTGSYKNGYFQLDENIFNLSATGGDPLFFHEKSTGEQYLVGFNAGKIYPTVPDTLMYWLAFYKGEVINSFYDFHQEDYNFVKKTISSKSKADWARIKNHMMLVD